MQDEYIYEEITIEELANRFFHITDFKVPSWIDVSDHQIEILGKNLKTNKDEYNLINQFVIKERVDYHYSNGKLKCSENHVLIKDDATTIAAKNDPEYTCINEPIDIVDFSIANSHNYYANDILSHNTTPGGMAIPFHASVRVRLQKAGQIKMTINGIEQVVGVKTLATIKKNRFGPPQRKCEFNIYFDSGIDNAGSWLIQLKNYDIVKTAGAWYSLENQNGEQLKFQSKDWLKIIESDPEFKEFIYKKLCDKLIMNYKTRGIGIDEVVIDTKGIDKDILDESFLTNTSSGFDEEDDLAEPIIQQDELLND